MDSEGKKKKMLKGDSEVWIPRNELSFFSVHLPRVMWHISPVLLAAACFLTYRRRMDSHPAAHASWFSPRATASCSLCNPVKATAAARLETTVWLLGSKQTARNQPESKKKNGDGETAVSVNSLWMLADECSRIQLK